MERRPRDIALSKLHEVQTLESVDYLCCLVNKVSNFGFQLPTKL